MTPRSIRRAAERRAVKLARKAAQTLPAIDPGLAQPELAEAMPPSAAEMPAETYAPFFPCAAAANANLSACTSPLTGHAVLLPSVDAASYTQFLSGYQTEFQPLGPLESSLVQTLAETAWRARRCLALEMALFARGRLEFADQFAAHHADLRESLLDVHTFLTYEKQIRSLQLQEARLTRRAEKTTAELRRLQQERNAREESLRRQQLEAAARLYQAALQNHQRFDPAQNGFVFSIAEIESYLTQKQTPKDRFAASRGRSGRSQAA